MDADTIGRSVGTGPSYGHSLCIGLGDTRF